MKTYTLEENEDGSFSFEGKPEKITPEGLKSLQALQPDAMWILICEVETYKRFAKERQGNNSEFEN